jgi:hypothetical protein
MKKTVCTLSALLAGIMILGLGCGSSFAAQKNEAPPAIHRDGSAVLDATTQTDGTALPTKMTRITQAQRQAAAKRAKAKGFVIQKVETATPDATTQARGGAGQ